MHRTLAAFLVLALGACTTQAPPTPTTDPAPTPTIPPTAEPMPSEPASPEPTDEVASPSWSGHPAAGLAVVRFIGPTDPATTQIFVVEADGSFRQVTGMSNDLGGSFPVWSPDGQRIAFTGAKMGEGLTGMVAVVDADGSDERQVSEGSFPRWSPDGAMLVVQEVDDVSDEDHSSWLVDPETGELTQLGVVQDGRWLGTDRLTVNVNSYAADGAATAGLYLMDLATGEQTHVADWTRAYPSPDGTRMLLVQQKDMEPATTWLADANGEVLDRLSDGGDPVWSPDGSRVAVLYDFDQDANPVHKVVDLEGNVLRADIVGSYPTWSPDGSRLALEVYRPDQPVVQVVDLASGEIVWEEQGRSPAWRP